jgi:hypothetical protein
MSKILFLKERTPSWRGPGTSHNSGFSETPCRLRIRSGGIAQARPTLRSTHICLRYATENIAYTRTLGEIFLFFFRATALLFHKKKRKENNRAVIHINLGATMTKHYEISR